MSAEVRLFTSRYHDFDPSWGTPVRITVGRPRFPLSYEVRAEVLELAPFGGLFRLRGDEFDRVYRDKLDSSGVEKLRRRFERIAEEHGDDRLVLLCFENVLAGERCHRRTWAEWWRQKTGAKVPEIEPSASGQLEAAQADQGRKCK